jgi:hypothetical protein
MTELLKKGVKFVWSEECDQAFHTLIKHLTSAPVLTQPDMSKPFEVFCDASGTGLGCVLMQETESLPMTRGHFDRMRRTTLLMILS